MRKSKKPGSRQGGRTSSGAGPEIGEILATTDFSAQSLPGVRYALALGERFGAAVSLLHVVEPAWPLSGMESLVLTRTSGEVAVLAEARLDAFAQRVTRADEKVKVVLRTGKPYQEIVLAADACQAGLIVIATHGHTGLKRVWLGSTAERVVRHAPCPVLTVPTRGRAIRAAEASRLQIKRVLVPIDFSNLSKDAMPYATRLAERFGADVTLMHTVQQYPIDYLLGAEVTNHTLVPLMKQAEADLERMAKTLRQATGIKTDVIVRNGTPYQAICEASKSLPADLIVLTTHGHTGLVHAWLGSTAERVVRLAHCPVLVVRELRRAAF